MATIKAEPSESAEDKTELQTRLEYINTQLEALAIIVYKQPVTRQEVSDIRGVASDNVIGRLIQLGLVEEAGRMKAPGRPILLKTTDRFLRCFGLESVKQLPHLPKPEEVSEKLEEIAEKPEENPANQEEISLKEEE